MYSDTHAIIGVPRKGTGWGAHCWDKSWAQFLTPGTSTSPLFSVPIHGKFGRMGLTVHYAFAANATTIEEHAHALVERMRGRAQQLPFAPAVGALGRAGAIVAQSQDAGESWRASQRECSMSAG